MIFAGKRHCGSGANITVAGLTRVKSECSKSPEQEASMLEEFSDKGVTDFEHLVIERDRAHSGMFSPLGDHSNDAPYGLTPA
jgi:hypothetical protein